MGFAQYRWEDGWAVVRGPSGSGGHGVTDGGEDGLFYNVRNGRLIIADNKAFSGGRSVDKATAIDPTDNLLQNLDDMIASVEQIGSTADVPFRQDVLRLLRQTRAAVRLGQPIPGRVTLRVHNEWGTSRDVGQRLRRLGVQFVDSNVPVVPPEGAERPSLGLRTAAPFTPAPPPGGSAGAPAENSFEGVLSEPAARVWTPAASQEADAAAAEAVLAEGGGAAMATVSRAGALVRVAAAFAIETAIFVLLSIGLAYLEERANRELIRRRMEEAEPRIQTALRDGVGKIDGLQALPARPTVWANITVRIDSSETTFAGWALANEHVSLPDADLAAVEISTNYRSGKRVEEGDTHYAGSQVGSTTTRDIHTFVTYSVPLAYDAFSLDRAGLTQRLAQNEADATRAVPPAVVQALYEENTALLRAMWGLGMLGGNRQ